MTTLKTTRLQVLVAGQRHIAVYKMPDDVHMLPIKRFWFGLDSALSPSRDFWLSTLVYHRQTGPFYRMWKVPEYSGPLARTWHGTFFVVVNPILQFYYDDGAVTHRFWMHLPLRLPC
jgi:hypothetical protein